MSIALLPQVIYSFFEVPKKADNSMLNSKTHIKSTIMKKTNNNSKNLQKFQQQAIQKPQLKSLKGGFIVEEIFDV